MQTISRDQIGPLGEALYQRIKAEIPLGSDGKFIVMDVLSGRYEIGDDHLATIQRLHELVPGALAYSKKIGYTATASIGGRILREDEKLG